MKGFILLPMLMTSGSLTILTNRIQGKHHFSYVPVMDLLLIRPWLPVFFFSPWNPCCEVAIPCHQAVEEHKPTVWVIRLTVLAKPSPLASITSLVSQLFWKWIYKLSGDSKCIFRELFSMTLCLLKLNLNDKAIRKWCKSGFNFILIDSLVFLEHFPIFFEVHPLWLTQK